MSNPSNSNSTRPKNKRRPQKPKAKKAEFDIAFRDIADLIVRRLGLVVVAALASFGLAAGYYFLYPPKFESKAEILVERRDASFNPDGGNSGGDKIVSSEVMATHTRIVQSARIVEEALERTGLATSESLLEAAGDEGIVPYVRENLYVTTADRNANVINLSFRHLDPDLSRQVLEAIVEQYQLFLIEKYQGDNSKVTSLIDDARKELEEELSALETDYREFRERAPIMIGAEDTSNVYEQRYEELLAEVSDVDSRIAEDSARLQLVRDGLKRYDENGSPDLQKLTLIDGLSAERMAILLAVDRGEAESASFQAEQPERMASATSEFSSLLEKRSQLVSMEKTHGNNHPDVVALREQIQLAEAFVETRAKNRSVVEDKPELTPDDVLDAYVNMLSNDLAALEQRKSSLLLAASEVEKQVRDLVAFELEGESLLHERLRKQDLYDGTVDNLRAFALSSGAGTYVHEVLEYPGLGEQVEPNLLTCAAIALFGTLLFGCCLVGVAELSDNSIHKSEELERIFASTVFSSIPEFSKDVESRNAMRLAKRSKSPINPMVLAHHAPQTRMAEIFRGLRTQLMFANGQSRVLSVTSAKSGEGKSTVASNLACSLAQTGRRVLLVDCDMRRPQVASLLGLSSKVGLREVLEGTVELQEAIQVTEAENLHVVTAGVIPKNPAELLDRRVFDDFLATVREMYDLVFLDCPPVLPVSDPSIIAPKTDGTIVVIKVDSQTRPQSQRVKDILEGVSANLLGLVINRSPNLREKYGYSEYSYQEYKQPQVKVSEREPEQVSI
ncbi:MAG: polysaccharide biosynthesis tyrosine autokinase [Pirellulaceae bacterium]